jgi:hypothetical protein
MKAPPACSVIAKKAHRGEIDLHTGARLTKGLPNPAHPAGDSAVNFHHYPSSPQCNLMTVQEFNPIRSQIAELRIEHRDLDDAIHRLAEDPAADQLRLTRLKKRKLRLKDTIARLESRLIPDLDA